jgi:GTP-binding protein EngB required for normal cell division
MSILGKQIDDESGKQSSDRSISTVLNDDSLSIDEIIDASLEVCKNLPRSCDVYTAQIQELRSRLGAGRLHLAVLGQFNRGKSTFINAMIGLRVLPTSVLPVTAVPTIISYNPQISCTVRFLNKKPDLVVRQSIERISETLVKYVAEENNPKNQLCVREVEVTCPAPLLENGTVLIDTPGFGSTHLHNTRTALEVLTECDAALFLLSADPPMTQTEMEFLKQVKTFVPKIFFILNKTDLLNSEQLEKVDRFIREILITKLDTPTDLNLFHICATKGEKACAHSTADADWVSSGMEKVKTEILDFLVKDKYFTLSQALNDKLDEALKGIKSNLSIEVDNYKVPIEQLKREREELIAQIDTVRKNMEKELKLIEVERNAVLQYLQEQISSKTNPFGQNIKESLDELLAHSNGKAESINGIAAAINRIIRENFAGFFISILTNVNKPLRKAAVVHEREFGLITKAASQWVQTANLESFELHEKIEKMETDFTTSWRASIPEKAITVNSSWTDAFRSKMSRINRFKAQFEKSTGDLIKENFALLSRHVEEIIGVTFQKIYSTLSNDYKQLSLGLEETIKRKDADINERISSQGESISSIEKTIENIELIRKKLAV